MALAKTVTTLHGFEAIDAYHRVENLIINNASSATFNLRSYKEVGKPFFNETIMSFNYDIDGENPIVQAYEHIKTLEEFSDAVDC